MRPRRGSWRGPAASAAPTGAPSPAAEDGGRRAPATRAARDRAASCGRVGTRSAGAQKPSASRTCATVTIHLGGGDRQKHAPRQRVPSLWTAAGSADACAPLAASRCLMTSRSPTSWTTPTTTSTTSTSSSAHRKHIELAHPPQRQPAPHPTLAFATAHLTPSPLHRSATTTWRTSTTTGTRWWTARTCPR